MSYGDEQAESRRLHSILKEGEGSMTPSASPLDPALELPTKSVRMSRELVAMLSEAGWDFGDPGPDGFYEPVIRDGYVLVNADMLAEALDKANAPATWWEPASTPFLADLIFAALKGPGR